jgi:predicted enzyme related to lactoylglutathione lyase
MSPSHLPAKGRFIWYELKTKDTEKALSFYTKLLGWNVKKQDMGELGTYTMVGVGETLMAGVVPLKETNLPSHWITYVTVPDVDAAAVKTEELGGKVVIPPTDIPNEGRFTAIVDPQGATIYPFKSVNELPPEMDGPPPAGVFCWNELLTSDPAAASRFYQEIFGWSTTSEEMGEMGTYWMFKRGEKEEAGAMKMPPQAEAPPHWLPYIAVNDVDATAKNCEDLGGKVYCKPTDIPGIGRFAVLADPEGADFAVFKGASK